jgi:hypothetical protein
LGKTTSITDIARGVMTAEPTPMSVRAAISPPGLDTQVARTDASRKTVMPPSSTFLRP